jgi:hypothetical protein
MGEVNLLKVHLWNYYNEILKKKKKGDGGQKPGAGGHTYN